MGKFCAADPDLPYTTFRSPADAVDRKELKTFLSDTVKELERSKKAMTALPPAPTASSKTLLAQYRKDVVKLDESSTKYLVDATVFPDSGLDAVRTLGGLDVVTFPGFLGRLKGHADLDAAYDRAKGCHTS
ncbi:hypothetical protein [Streptomyces sp. 150FB]|uniref:hypothetical protein n=1 Tax=Streptomyces sp. 150FB TaxID=1576605 RepID=UPI0012379F06|nr:hypothetical protein [Streptomyces sp. 150FB]